MGRKIPQSGKAKKEKLQVKRAYVAAHSTRTLHPQEEAERQATSRAEIATMLPNARPSGGASAGRFRTPEEAERTSRKDVQLRLESRFLKLPLDLLNHHRLISATEPLARPIPPQYGYCLSQDLQPAELQGLTLPKRPKWRYTQTKLEVEKNEEGVYAQWLRDTDSNLSTFASSLPSTPAPSFFERNLQVWRQLWRVTEASQILLVLVDVRFPLIHYPPSLEQYVKSLRPKKEIIIVLTKTDLVPQWLSEAWKEWFEEREGPNGASVVIMESYKETERNDSTQGTQPRFTPSAPASSRHSLVSALRRAHHKLLQPPSVVSDYPERLAKWRPNLRINVDFDSVENLDSQATALDTATPGNATAGPSSLSSSASLPASAPIITAKTEKKTRRNKQKDVYVPRLKKPVPGQVVEIVEEEVIEEVPVAVEEPVVVEELVGDDAHPFLTIGLIGQPNVGKSSLLNALLGRKVVRASKTPGKTKSLQTIFWNSTVRLCDCPGLVCPSFAGMERQVLSGILPIQNVEPVLYFIAQRMPLEEILKLKHTDDDDFPLGEEPYWTADTLLANYAISQGFITAKAGRPDLYRAGAYILRQLHCSAIPWAFLPPSSSTNARNRGAPKDGIYLSGFKRSERAEREARERALRDEGDEDEDEEEDSEEQGKEAEGDDDEESDADEAEGMAVQAVRSAFSVLMVEGEDDSEEESDEDD